MSAKLSTNALMAGVEVTATGNPVRTAQVVRCSHDGCSVSKVLPVKGALKPPEAVLNICRRANWFIDTKSGSHFCPEHNPMQRKKTMVQTQDKGARLAEEVRKIIGQTPDPAVRGLLSDVLRSFGVTKGAELPTERHDDFLKALGLRFDALRKGPPAETAPRQPTKEQRRAIFREIDESYHGSAYVEGYTDKTIAEKLHVPWSWVAAVREENFGPAGPDPEVVKLKAALDGAEKRHLALEDKVESILAEMDLLSKEVASIRAKIEALEDQK